MYRAKIAQMTFSTTSRDTDTRQGSRQDALIACCQLAGSAWARSRATWMGIGEEEPTRGRVYEESERGGFNFAPFLE
jgi:hypothetical protein